MSADGKQLLALNHDNGVINIDGVSMTVICDDLHSMTNIITRITKEVFMDADGNKTNPNVFKAIINQDSKKIFVVNTLNENRHLKTTKWDFIYYPKRLDDLVNKNLENLLIFMNELVLTRLMSNLRKVHEAVNIEWIEKDSESYKVLISLKSFF